MKYLMPVTLLGIVVPMGAALLSAQDKIDNREKPVDTRPAINPLHAAVRVNGSNASCGTIIKIAEEDEAAVAYVLTTGHLQKRMEMGVEVFYRKGEKLKEAEKYTGELVCLIENNSRGIDFSVVKVTLKGPAKEYTAARIAKDVPFNKECVSIGCDKGIEPKEFKVTPTRWRIKNADVWVRHKTDEVSNGGRSGGGLFLNGELVGVYWGSYTSSGDSDKDTTDRGNGMATGCVAVRDCLNALKLHELLE